MTCLLQVPDRIDKDFCNKSASSGAALTKTFAYLAKRSLGQLRGSDLLMVYNLVRMIKTSFISVKGFTNIYVLPSLND